MSSAAIQHGDTFNFIDSKFDLKKKGCIPLPIKKEQRYIFHDDNKNAFGLYVRVTHRGTISFYVTQQITPGEVVFCYLGKYPKMSIEVAREQARIKSGELAQRNNPNKQKAQNKVLETTLQELFDLYKDEHRSHKTTKEPLTEETKKQYDSWMRLTFADIMDKPFLQAITVHFVKQRFDERSYGTDTIRASESGANNAFRLLQSMINFAKRHSRFKDASGVSMITRNPVSILDDERLWHPDGESEDFLLKNEILPFIQQALKLNLEKAYHNARDLLLLMLFMGLRSGEARGLKRENVFLDDEVPHIYLKKTKNRLPCKFALNEVAQKIIAYRLRIIPDNCEYLFPNRKLNGPCSTTLSALKNIAKKIDAKTLCCNHGLRRTFSTTGKDAVKHISHISALLNHVVINDALPKSKTTDRYVFIELEDKAKYSNQVCNAILANCEALDLLNNNPWDEIEEIPLAMAA